MHCRFIFKRRLKEDDEPIDVKVVGRLFHSCVVDGMNDLEYEDRRAKGTGVYFASYGLKVEHAEQEQGCADTAGFVHL